VRAARRGAQVARFHGFSNANHARIVEKLRVTLDGVKPLLCALEVTVHLQDAVGEGARVTKMAAGAAPAPCAPRSPGSRTPKILSRNCDAISLTTRKRDARHAAPLAQVVGLLLLLQLRVEIPQLLD
jgi:hypothetical protein